MLLLFNNQSAPPPTPTPSIGPLLTVPRRLAARFGVAASGDIYRPPTLTGGMRAGTPVVHGTSVFMAILPATNTAAREFTAMLGVDQSRFLGYVAPGVDTVDGDEWHVAGRVFTVDRADPQTDMTIAALSEQRKGA